MEEIDKLKARVYDLLVMQQDVQNQITQTNNQIAELKFKDTKVNTEKK
jgi:L-ribulose-5-phosphate 3-epimerase UlaE